MQEHIVFCLDPRQTKPRIDTYKNVRCEVKGRVISESMLQ